MKNFNVKTREMNVTNRTECLDAYFREIKNYKIFSKDEEMQLILQYKKTGDFKIREMVIKSNLRFVVSVAKDYIKTNTKVALTDLINEGNIGLMIALEKYEPATNFKFISYGVWWVRNKMLSALNSHNDIIKHPHSFKPEDKCGYTSLDKIIITDEERTLLDVLENPNSPQADATYNKLDLNKLIDLISNENVKNIVKLKIGIENDPMIFKEISNYLKESGIKISEQTVNTKYKRAIFDLKREIKKSGDIENLLYL